jgi:hypothetical protein
MTSRRELVFGPTWQGLELEVSEASTKLRVEYARPQRFRVTVQGKAALWARAPAWEVDPLGGAAWLLADDGVPHHIVPPITSTELRANGAAPKSNGWFRFWANHFWSNLESSAASPLHPGLFHLSRANAVPTERRSSHEPGAVYETRRLISRESALSTVGTRAAAARSSRCAWLPPNRAVA